MKILLYTLVAAVLLGCSLTRKSRIKSSDNEPQTVRIYCMDGFNNQGFPDCRAYIGDSLIGISDSTGWMSVTLAPQTRENTLRLVANDSLHSDGNYESFNPYFNSETTVIFYPNQKYENLIWERENEKYGFQSKEKMLNPKKSPLLGELTNKPTTDAAFPGGNAGLAQYIKEEIVFPQLAIENNISGSVRLHFIVQKDGSISHLVPAMGTHPILNQEAIRVIRNSPKWTPGTEEGKQAKTHCLLPVNFKLD